VEKITHLLLLIFAPLPTNNVPIPNSLVQRLLLVLLSIWSHRPNPRRRVSSQPVVLDLIVEISSVSDHSRSSMFESVLFVLEGFFLLDFGETEDGFAHGVWERERRRSEERKKRRRRETVEEVSSSCEKD